MIWPGVKPMLLRMPILLYPATTAPLTTLATISADSTRPMTPNATTNGTYAPTRDTSLALTVRYDWAPVTVPAGSAAVRVARSPRTAAVVPASRNRYSICALAGVPGGRSLPISAGRTQASADLVIEAAMPTTFSRGVPGNPVTVSVEPTGTLPLM